MVTAKQITAEDRAKLNGYVTTIMEKAEFDRERFTAEVRRAMSGRAGGGLTWPTVLVVEDNPANMTLAIFLLRVGGPHRAQRDRRRGRADAGARASSPT